MKILFVNSEWNGVAYWRMWEPARFLNKRDDIQVTYWTTEKEMTKELDEWERLAKSHDIIVSGRVSEPKALATLLMLREVAQKPVVTEMDDNWWDVDPNSPAWDWWKPHSMAYNTAELQCLKSDFFQFSTMPLKRQMCSKFGKWEQSYIAPNLIDFDKWHNLKGKYQPSRKGTIRLGWGGSATHYSDFLIIVPALVKIMEKYKNVELHVRGLKADFFVQKENKIEFDPLRNKVARRHKSPLPLDRVRYYDGCGFDVWPEAVARMNMDICMVPLVKSKFNEAKSNCRYLEFSSLGVPGVYGDVYPYAKTIDHGKDGFLAYSNDKWFECLSNLIENEKLRNEMGEAAEQKCFEEYSLQKKISTWADMYYDMHDKISSCRFEPYYKEEQCPTLQADLQQMS